MAFSSMETCLEGLYVLTDVRLSGISHAGTAEALLKGGASIIQLRDKEISPRRYYEAASKIKELCSRYVALFIVNDRVDIALAVGADGVHLGQDDLTIAHARKILGPDFIIGISTHSLDQALEAQQGGADYIGFGPMFPTATKDAGEPQGLKPLKSLRASIRIPIAAIGGINPENACSVLESGADMLAVASSVLVPGRIEEFTRDFLEKIEYCRRQR